MNKKLILQLLVVSAFAGAKINASAVSDFFQGKDNNAMASALGIKKTPITAAPAQERVMGSYKLQNQITGIINMLSTTPLAASQFGIKDPKISVNDFIKLCVANAWTPPSDFNGQVAWRSCFQPMDNATFNAILSQINAQIFLSVTPYGAGIMGQQSWSGESIPRADLINLFVKNGWYGSDIAPLRSYFSNLSDSALTVLVKDIQANYTVHTV